MKESGAEHNRPSRLSVIADRCAEWAISHFKFPCKRWAISCNLTHDELFPVTPRFTFRALADCARERANSNDTASLSVQGTACEHRNSNDTARLPVQAGASDRSKRGERP